jgi:hypothetical protein
MKPEVMKTSLGLSFMLNTRFKMVEDKPGEKIKEIDQKIFQI